MSGFKVWLLESRPQFLALSVVLAFLGAAVASYHGHVDIWRAVLAGVGLVLAHASVNILEVLLIPRYLTLDEISLHHALLTGVGLPALLILILTRGRLGYRPSQEQPGTGGG